MSRRRTAPAAVVVVAMIAVAVVGTMVVRSGSDSSSSETQTPTVRVPEWATPSEEEASALPAKGCGVVRYTPPEATSPHDADLCRPANPTGRGVVLIHGGGGYTGSRSGLEPWATWYRSQGFVTLAVDYTLVGDGTPEPVYPAPERDVKAAVQFLRRHHVELELAPEAILVHGSSAGARLGAQALVTGDDPWFDGSDLWAGVPDHVNGLVGFYGYYDGTLLVTEEYFGGTARSTDPAVQERLAHADSISQAAGATGPVLLFHGDVDGLVDVGQTERFGRALTEAGTAVSTTILVDENHAFDQRPGDPFTDVGRRAARDIRAWLMTSFPPVST